MNARNAHCGWKIGASEPRQLQVGLETAAHATALGKSLLTTMPRRTLRHLLTAQGMRRFTRHTPTDVETVETALRRVRRGDVVIERGEFRDDAACASIATRTPDSAGWWAIGVSTRGLDLPVALLAHLRHAADDLAAHAG
jgi:DNA-binding IclR family transcriptional regulator